MLYRIGTKRELLSIANKLPKPVHAEIYRDTVILDAEYGEERNYLKCGGYSIVIETVDDLSELQAIVDYTLHPCEWVTSLGENSGYLSCLFVLNNDFSITVYMPITIAPETILRELND